MLKAWLLRATVLFFLPAIAHAATVVVDDESNSWHATGCAITGIGPCSFFDAISFANVNPGPDVIHFNLAGEGIRNPTCGGELTDDAGVTIDGFSQPGASPNTLASGNDASWRIRCFGGANGFLFKGLVLRSSNNTVRGIMWEGWGDTLEILGSNNRVSGNLISGIPSGPSTGVHIHAGAQGNIVGGVVPADRNVIAGCLNGVFLHDVGTSNNSIQGNFIGPIPESGGSQPNNVAIVIRDGATSNLVGGAVIGARNVISGNGHAIDLFGPAHGNRVEGNFIGTTPDGMARLSNDVGIYLLGDSGDNVIGGSEAGTGNLISGNGGAISMAGGYRNRISGNRIGTNAPGTAAISNSVGIGVGHGARDTLIGGTTPSERNVISGNGGSGIFITTNVTRTTVIGNFIGIDASGLAPLGNGSNTFETTAAVLIADKSYRNRIGGLLPGEANVIAHHGNSRVGGWGIRIPAGSIDGDSFGNAILSNRIYGNFDLAIDFHDTGPTLNDEGDADTGSNNRQNYPVLSAVSTSIDGTRVSGTLDSTPLTTFTLQFFAAARCDPSGHGEAEVLLGSVSRTTDANGDASFDVLLKTPPAAGYRVSATATDSDGNTSELSPCFPRASLFHTLPPCRLIDTREPPGEYGGPALAANGERSFLFPGRCGIPSTAQAVALNITATGSATAGNLVIYPAVSREPLSAALNYRPQRARGNNAVTALGESGSVVIRCNQSSGTVHVIVDVSGYFE